MYEAYTQGDRISTRWSRRLELANKIDVVYVGGYHTEAGLILRQMRGQGMTSQMISGDAIATNEFWSITGPAGEGMMFTFGSDPRKRPHAAAIVKRFKDKGVDPEGYTLYTLCRDADLDAGRGESSYPRTHDRRHNLEVGQLGKRLGEHSLHPQRGYHQHQLCRVSLNKDGTYSEL